MNQSDNSSHRISPFTGGWASRNGINTPPSSASGPPKSESGYCAKASAAAAMLPLIISRRVIEFEIIFVVLPARNSDFGQARVFQCACLLRVAAGWRTAPFLAAARRILHRLSSCLEARFPGEPAAARNGWGMLAVWTPNLHCERTPCATIPFVRLLQREFSIQLARAILIGMVSS